MKFKRKFNLFAVSLMFAFLIISVNAYSFSVKVASLKVNKGLAKVGEIVTISASATGGKNLLYKFYIHDGAKWYVLQDYSTKNTTTWKPYRASTSKIKVAVKETYSGKNYSCKEIQYQVYSNVKVENITTDKKSPQSTNTSIKIIPKVNLATGVMYKYSVFDGKVWEVLKNYSYDKYCIWKPTVSANYKIKVDVKEANSLRCPDASMQTSFQISDAQVQALSTNVASPRKVGNTIVISSKSTYRTSPLYRYWLHDGTAWTMVKDYSGDATYKWVPSKEGKYTIKVDVKDKASLKAVDSSKTMSFQILKYGVINYVDTNLTLSDFLNSQMNLSAKPQIWNNDLWVNASKSEVNYYLNPNNFINDYGINQFLKLTYMEGITVQDLNAVLLGKGVLEGKGQVFLNAAKSYNINPVYLVAHSLLETGNGTSTLAKGISLNSIHETLRDINSKIVPLDKTVKVYNVYGYGAYDSNPDLWGSEKAYHEGWFTVDQAIIGGANYISKGYINSTTYNQNTLYKMKWDLLTLYKTPVTQYAHQYATDIGWAYKQSKIMKNIVSKMQNSMFYYEIPKFMK